MEQRTCLIEPYDAWHHKRPFEELVTCFCQAFERTDAAEVGHQILAEVEAKHLYLIAWRDEGVLGFVSWRTWFGLRRNRLAELVHIGTVRNHGVPHLGTKLVEAMETDMHRFYRDLGLPGCRKILLFTHADNTIAQRFYTRCGYQPLTGPDNTTVILPEFAREGVDEIMMTKEFPDMRLDKQP